MYHIPRMCPVDFGRGCIAYVGRRNEQWGRLGDDSEWARLGRDGYLGRIGDGVKTDVISSCE